MLKEVFMGVCNASPRLNKFLWKQLYRMLAFFLKDNDWKFMNYGYAPLGNEPGAMALAERDEPNRFFIQLYAHVVSRVRLEGLDVLEVGCGRGGGSDYLKRYHKPRTMTGVDYSKSAVKLCGKKYRVEGLNFVRGDSEALPFADESFDAVVNVESSHCYSSMGRFLEQVNRVLKPGGYFLFADLRDTDKMPVLRSQLKNSPLEIVSQADITDNVIEALHKDADARISLYKKFLPGFLIRPFQEFAGNTGSKIYRAFCAGEVSYFSGVLKKSAV